jgi:RNA polymerase sigma-70 factor, ECF subfamily
MRSQMTNARSGFGVDIGVLHSARSCLPVATTVVLTDDDQQSPTADEARWTMLREKLTRAVRRQCPRWLSDHAEDLVQAAVVKVMAIVGGSEGKRSLSSFYLYRVAHSALVDEIRRRQRRREVTLELDQSEEQQMGDAHARVPRDPEQDASLRELGLAVRDCLRAMNRDRRLAVTLYLQGHSVPEAARILGWPGKRTENLVYRGLADLRQCLLAKGHTP